MGIQAGTKQNIGVSVKAIDAWLKTAAMGADFRAAKGLYLRKTAGGAFWFFRSKSPVSGKQLRIALWGDESGSVNAYPDASLKEATIRAAVLRVQVDGGVDPVLRARADKEESAHQATQAKLHAELERRETEAAIEQANLTKKRRLTTRQVFERWASTDLAPHVGGDGKSVGRVDGGQYVREQFERRVFPLLGEMALIDVRKADVLAITDAAKAEGKLRTANVLLADLKQMFRFAAEREIIEHSPIELVQKKKTGGNDVRRDRVLSIVELAALVAQLPSANLSKRTVLGLWLILATGCRIGELMGAVWADSKPRQKALQAVADEHNTAQKSGSVKLGFVDLAARSWYLPTTKNQRDHTIHLSDFALQQFTELEALREGDQATGAPVAWVFPDTRATGPVCIKSFGKQLADRQRSADERMMNRTRAVDSLALAGGRWTAHDLRRTASTLMSQLGISNDAINECLNHIKQGMSGVYIQDRRELEQVRAFDALGARLAGIESGDAPGSNVVPLRVANFG